MKIVLAAFTALALTHPVSARFHVNYPLVNPITPFLKPISGSCAGTYCNQ